MSEPAEPPPPTEGTFTFGFFWGPFFFGPCGRGPVDIGVDGSRSAPSALTCCVATPERPAVTDPSDPRPTLRCPHDDRRIAHRARGRRGRYLRVRAPPRSGGAGSRRCRSGRRIATAVEAERALAASEAALAVERGSFDTRVQNAIKALSTEALRENANAFTEQALGRLGVMVEPLAKSLEKVETNVNLLEQQRQRAYGEIHRSWRSSGSRTRACGAGDRQPRQRAARRVAHARALGRDPAATGDRDGGDAPDCDFEEQPTVPGEEGRVLRPDVIVKLPGGKSIVIDSKVSLVGYLRAHEEARPRRARRGGSGGSRPAGARAHPEARPEGVLAAAAGDAGVRRHVPPRRVVVAAALSVDPSLYEVALSKTSSRRRRRTSSACCVPCTTAGSRRRSPRERARSASSAASCTSGSRRWARTCRGSAGRWTAP